MVVLKCKMCGGDLRIEEGKTVCECEYCGSRQTVPSLDNEKKVALFTRANRLRSLGEFDKAFGVYESIVADFPEEAEAYWGLILCKYGIEYVDDPTTGKKVPTCHRTSFNNVLEDSDFEMVLEYADTVSRAEYRAEAKEIERIRNDIIEVSSKEDPYDIFICYKETDDNGDRTIDSVIAQDVYDKLTEKGYRVFFSRVSLEDKIGQEYEPYIFSALHSAKIMLVFGTSYDHFNAVWVRNEWSRYLALIAKGEKKTLIPCYKDVDAYDMPKEFNKLQAQDMGKVGAVQDLIRGVDKIIGTAKTEVRDSTIDELIEDKRAREVQAKKTKKIIAIVAVSVCLVLASVITVFSVQLHQQKEERYIEAVKIMQRGNDHSYFEAYSTLFGLAKSHYKDSYELAKRCEEKLFASISGQTLSDLHNISGILFEDGTCVINSEDLTWQFDDDLTRGVNNPGINIVKGDEIVYYIQFNSFMDGNFIGGPIIDKRTGVQYAFHKE